MLKDRIAAGLHAAHQHGIVHRDVSPDNIIVPDGDVRRAKIVDFGIARSTRAGDRTIIGGGFAGKYNYVSPEQLGLYGGMVTARSDIYSLGIVLAQCLTGQQMDMGGSEFEVIEKHRVVPDLGAIKWRYRQLLIRMLQPDPKDRPESMAEIAAWRPHDVDEAVASTSMSERQATSRNALSPPAQSAIMSAPPSTTRIPRKRASGAGERFELMVLSLLALLSCGGVAFYFTYHPAQKPNPQAVSLVPIDTSEAEAAAP